MAAPLPYSKRNGAAPDGRPPGANGRAGQIGPAVKALAALKRLDPSWLAGLGVEDAGGGVVSIPYFDETGELLFRRKRNPAGAEKRFHQPKGVPLRPYGLWKLDEGHKQGRLFLDEGESDTWTLWAAAKPALGLPGARTFKKLQAEHLSGVETVYIVPDADEPGEDFVAGLVARLGTIGWCGKAFRLRLPASVKDVSDLRCASPEGFGAKLDRMIRDAEQLLPAARNSLKSAAPTWGDPLPLGGQPPPPPFPLEVLPRKSQQFVREGAEALPCPSDYIAVPLIVSAGAAVGQSRVLKITDSHEQPALVYAGVVGPPGSAKSPALELAVDPLRKDQTAHLLSWQEEKKAYDAACDEYERRKKPKKGETLDLEAVEKPVRPVLTRRTVGNATAESLAPILQENPRGVLFLRDELTSWVTSMNQYREGGKGADLQFWLAAWSRTSDTVDRRSRHDEGPIHMERPFIAAVGGLTPSKLPELRGDVRGRKASDDGFMDRILFAYPTPTPSREETWATVSELALQQHEKLIAKLLSLEMIPPEAAGPEGKPAVSGRPYFVHLDPDARQVWQQFTRLHADELNNPEFPDHLRGPWSKLRGYCGRLALILHCLRWAAGEVVNDKGPIDGESMRRATLLTAYFKGMARRVYSCMDANPSLKAAEKIWGWIVREKRTAFKKWEPYRDLQSNSLFPTADALDEPLLLLVQHNLIREEDVSTRSGPGRKPAALYAVNPSALGRENRVNRANAAPGVAGKPTRTTDDAHSHDLHDSHDDAGECSGAPAKDEKETLEL